MTKTFKQFLIESEIEKLKKNRKQLTDDERAECIAKKAVWHNGPGGKENSAVWKSVNKNGKTTYVTNTHRAYKTANTLGAAIGAFHDVIKDTA